MNTLLEWIDGNEVAIGVLGVGAITAAVLTQIVNVWVTIADRRYDRKKFDRDKKYDVLQAITVGLAKMKQRHTLFYAQMAEVWLTLNTDCERLPGLYPEKSLRAFNAAVVQMRLQGDRENEPGNLQTHVYLEKEFDAALDSLRDEVRKLVNNL